MFEALNSAVGSKNTVLNVYTCLVLVPLMVGAVFYAVKEAFSKSDAPIKEPDKNVS